MKRFFLLLLAINALLVLFIMMQRDMRVAIEDVSEFSQQGALVEVVQESAPVNNVVAGVCGEVGPLESMDLAKQILRRVTAKGMGGSILERDVLVSTDYWVIIPPRASEKQAFRLLKQLQLANIDSYIVTQGEYANAISLGLFTVQSSAYGVKERMNDSGFEAVVQEIQRTQKQFFIVFSGDVSLVRDAISDMSVAVSNKSCKSR